VHAYVSRLKADF